MISSACSTQTGGLRTRTDRTERLVRLLSSARLYLAVVVTAVVVLFPFYWIAISSLKSPRELVKFPPDLLPLDITVQHYRNLLQFSPYVVYLKNSCVVAGLTVIVTMPLAVLGAYSLARFRFPGKSAISTSLLLTYLFPGILLLVPLYTMAARLGILDSHSALVIVNVTFTLPFSILLLRTFYEAVPVELDEAAMLDGADRITVLRRILVPLCRPGIVSTATYVFIASWGEFLFSSVLIIDDSRKTLPVGLSELMSLYVIDWGLISAGAVLTVLPVIALFASLGRHFVGGLTAGALKG